MFKFNQTICTIGCTVLLALSAFILISWSGTVVHKTGINFDIYAADTIPGKSHNLEDQLIEIRKAQENLQRELSQKDWTKIEAEMENALSRINTKEIEVQMQNALAELDKSMARIDKEQLLRKADVEKIQGEMAKVQLELKKDFNSQNWQKELQEAQVELAKAMQEIKAIDPVRIKEELSKARTEMKISQENLALELARAKKDLKENKISIKKSLDQARKDLEKTRREYEGYKTMIGEMQQEVLISDPKNFRIAFKDGNLLINGNKQPDSVTNRYRKYFRDKPILLKNEGDRFETED